jgi:flagellar hook-associated protein 3 FlgL
MIRVSSSTLTDNFINETSGLESEQTQLQAQVASGLEFSQLSDNPTGMDDVLNLQDQSSQNTQYQKNITDLQQTATSSYSAIQQLESIANQAATIATQSSSANSAQLSTYASQVSNLIQEAVNAANTQDDGQYLFGGTATNKPPYVATTDAQGNVTAVTYQGNSTVPSVEISSGNAVSVQVPGSNTSGSGPNGLITDPTTGADFFNHLIALQKDLASGNSSAVANTDIQNLGKDQNNFSLQAGLNGVVQAQLNNVSNSASLQSTQLDQTMSQDDSADLTTTMTKLSQAQNAFEAALESGATLFNQNQSLLYYLA